MVGSVSEDRTSAYRQVAAIPFKARGQRHEPRWPDLLLHQLDAAIQGAARLGVIRTNRGVWTVAKGLQAVSTDGILRRKNLHDGSSAALRESPD